MAAKSERARSRAAQQGALVKKARAGVRGALAELARRFPKRSRELETERRAERKKKKAKARPKTKKKTKAKARKLPSSRPLSQSITKVRRRELAEARRLTAEAETRARAAEAAAAKARAEKAALERAFEEALRKDREAAAERTRRLKEARARAEAAGFPKRKTHARWEGPVPTDLRALEDRLRDKTYMGLTVHAPRMLRTKHGMIVVGFVVDPANGERVRLRGYEIRVRSETTRGEHVEDSYVFWGDREGINAHDPAEWFKDDIYAGVEREHTEDMIVAWREPDAEVRSA